MLTRSCSEGDLEGVRVALQSGVDVNSRDALGYTGLMRALWKRHTAVASLLLEQEGIDVDINCNGQTALNLAAKSDENSECLALILSKSSSVNPVDANGVTALLFAVHHNAVRCVQLLLSDKRTDPNIKDHDVIKDDDGDSPLMWAVTCNRVACLELLLSDERTDPNIKNNWGGSPLMSAVKSNRVACVKLLLADPRVDLMTRDKRSRREKAR